MLLIVVVRAGASGLAVWWWRWRARAADVPAKSSLTPVAVQPVAGHAAAAAPPAAPPSAYVAVDAERLQTANVRASRRLWNLAFASATGPSAAVAADGAVRENVVAMLQVDTLDPKLVPRRPALLPAFRASARNSPRLPRLLWDRTERAARHVGELLGTVSFLESQTVISRDERLDSLNAAGLPSALTESLWRGLHGHA